MSTADGLFWRQEVVRAALTIPTNLKWKALCQRASKLGQPRNGSPYLRIWHFNLNMTWGHFHPFTAACRLLYNHADQREQVFSYPEKTVTACRLAWWGTCMGCKHNVSSNLTTLTILRCEQQLSIKDDWFKSNSSHEGIPPQWCGNSSEGESLKQRISSL